MIYTTGPLPVALADDPPMLRGVVTSRAERAGCTVAVDAAITTRLMEAAEPFRGTEFDPGPVLFAEIEVTDPS